MSSRAHMRSPAEFSVATVVVRLGTSAFMVENRARTRHSHMNRKINNWLAVRNVLYTIYGQMNRLTSQIVHLMPMIDCRFDIESSNYFFSQSNWCERSMLIH